MVPRPLDDPDAAVRALEPVLQSSGWALLNSLPPYREHEALRQGARLREAGHSPELVSAVMTQSRLRAKAVDKFGEFASSMLFTQPGLEQATRLPVAAMHAERFQRAGVESVADLGCGIGGDAMALAGLGLQVRAVDRDPLAVAVATMNLRSFPAATVHLGRAEGHDPSDAEGIWLDPARRAPTRSGTRRLHDPEEYEPPLSAVIELARRLGRDGEAGPLGAKLGPGIDRDALPRGVETQWLSFHGQVLEATAWFGPLAREGVTSSAVLIDRAGAHRLDRGEEAIPDPAPAALGDHLYEPDGAVIRAGLIGSLASDLGAHTLDETIAYLTGDHRIDTPFARGYAVRDVMPFGLKRLTAYLREHHLGVLEIKKRGTAVEPDELRRKLRPRRFGDESATVILTRVGGEQSVIIASPHGTGAAEGTAT
ncbi:SAM-dependent methyltransferase [Brachybacterium sp. P6-10-X1]|uniref:THUMP-like domain-containing protein n=1 Tax=Brachybacterium sp. P6-10-X1 TaxID=1903186 RepID=UPI0009719F39|nr:50S ribosomal protein L11 methyltransferase [Brachybacterium sp. P6-10-X1]APX34294.1 SAM-dependent methyltransferase [Brachybacterium sp. P6-10-X1]